MTGVSMSEQVRRVIIGTAGHIDHGKTALVRALTGIDADRLKEEKDRGITIDIGFANLSIENVRFGFVDVPGHERFIKNMLAGVHGIDAVILVVAADESVMPQTREHFDICRLLQVDRGLVALTKADLVEEEFLELVKSEVREFVAGSFLEGAPLVPVSSKTGYGVDSLKRELVRLASDLPLRDENRIARLPIDRVFSAKGFGTIVTGTLISGYISVGQELELLPQRQSTLVRGLQVYGNAVNQAHAGERTAINLQSVSVDQVERGDIVVPPGRLSPTSLVDAELQLLSSAPQCITNRARVRLHHGSAELLARVVLLDRAVLKPAEVGLVQFRFGGRTAYSPGDRFIIRRYSPQITIGGGVVVDPAPEKHRAYSPGRPDSEILADSLRGLASAAIDQKLYLWIEAGRERGMDVAALGSRSGLSDQEVGSILRQLEEQNLVVEIAGRPLRYFAQDVVTRLRRRMAELLLKYHQQSPFNEGISREELRRRLLSGMDGDASIVLLNYLCALPDFVADRDVVRLRSHSIQLNQQEAEVESRILETLSQEALRPSLPEDLLAKLKIDLALGRRLLVLLHKQGKTVRIGEYYFARAPLDSLIQRLRLRREQEPTIDVSRFKELTGLSRKYAIPLLEHLDRIRVTRRLGDIREVL